MQTENWLLRYEENGVEPKNKNQKQIKISAERKCLISLAWCLVGVNEAFTKYIKKKRDV